ncbi:hypothetical protein MBLNU459_g4433t1 [Dothideomycetes sp. NU459]
MPVPTFAPSRPAAFESKTTSSMQIPHQIPTSKPPSTPSILVTNHLGESHLQMSTHMTSAYRQRYASYLAATFGISLQAALDETDQQLAPRRTSDVSEAEVYRV